MKPIGAVSLILVAIQAHSQAPPEFYQADLYPVPYSLRIEIYANPVGTVGESVERALGSDNHTCSPLYEIESDTWQMDCIAVVSYQDFRGESRTARPMLTFTYKWGDDGAALLTIVNGESGNELPWLSWLLNYVE